jgi:hypothetical protein
MSAIAIPALQRRLGIDRPAVDVDLEMEMTTDGTGIARLPHRPDSLAGVDALAAVDQGWPRHVGVEVGAVLAFAVDQQVIAVEDRVIAGPQHLAVADRYQRCVAGGDDVEAFVGAAAVAGGPEFADRAAGAVWALDREDVAVEGGGAIAIENLRRRRSGGKREEEKR